MTHAAGGAPYRSTSDSACLLRSCTAFPCSRRVVGRSPHRQACLRCPLVPADEVRRVSLLHSSMRHTQEHRSAHMTAVVNGSTASSLHLTCCEQLGCCHVIGCCVREKCECTVCCMLRDEGAIRLHGGAWSGKCAHVQRAVELEGRARQQAVRVRQDRRV